MRNTQTCQQAIKGQRHGCFSSVVIFAEGRKGEAGAFNYHHAPGFTGFSNGIKYGYGVASFRGGETPGSDGKESLGNKPFLAEKEIEKN